MTSTTPGTWPLPYFLPVITPYWSLPGILASSPNADLAFLARITHFLSSGCLSLLFPLPGSIPPHQPHNSPPAPSFGCFRKCHLCGVLSDHSSEKYISTLLPSVWFFLLSDILPSLFTPVLDVSSKWAKFLSPLFTVVCPGECWIHTRMSKKKGNEEGMNGVQT